MLIGIIVGPAAEAAGDGGRAILLQRADDVAEARDLARRHQARQHDVDIGLRQRKLGRAEVVHRVAEAVDPVAVDVGDGAGGAEHEVAGQQRDAHRVAGPQRARGAAVDAVCAGCASTPKPAGSRDRSAPASSGASTSAREAGRHQRHGNRLQHRRHARRQARVAGQRASCEASSANGRARPRSRLQIASRSCGDGGQVIATGRVPGVDGGEGRGIGHLADGRDPGDRLLRKLPELSTTPRRAAGRRCRPGCRSCRQ